MRSSILVLLSLSLLSISVAADAKRCEKGMGYRYINGKKVCPEEIPKTPHAVNPYTGETYPIINSRPCKPGRFLDPRTGYCYAPDTR